MITSEFSPENKLSSLFRLLAVVTTFIGIAANVMLFVQGLYGRPIFVFLLLVTVPLTWLLAHLASQKAASLAKDAPPQDQKS